MGDRKYPSIMELAVKAGKWSFIAGSSAAIIGATGCEEESLAGDSVDDVIVLDQLADQGNEQDFGLAGTDFVEPDVLEDVIDPVDPGFPELMGVAPYDIEEGDSKVDVIAPDVPVEDVPVVDVNETDPGLMGDFAFDAYPPTDVVDPDVVDPAQDVPPADVVDDDAFLSGGIPMEDL